MKALDAGVPTSSSPDERQRIRNSPLCFTVGVSHNTISEDARCFVCLMSSVKYEVFKTTKRAIRRCMGVEATSTGPTPPR